MFAGQPHHYGGGGPPTSMPGSPAEHPGESFADVVERVHRRNGVVSAAVVARSLIVSQLRFRWRGEDGTTFGSAALAPLERPGGGLSRPALLTQVEQDVAYAGNAYIRRTDDDRLVRLRPDWVDVLLSSSEAPSDPTFAADVQKIGYLFHPGGRQRKARPVPLSLAEVAHFAPEPHPTRVAIGESWVTSVFRELVADGQATDHVTQYFANAATANMVFTSPEKIVTREQFTEWVDAIEAGHTGVENAWRNVYVGHGTDVTVVGSSLGDLAMKDLQGGFETRVALRSRVPASVLGVREGLAGSALNAGNYGAARRMWADGWFAGHADALCASLESVVAPPRPSVELTFDRDRILFLQEDRKDEADIAQAKASAIETLIRAGYTARSAAEAVASGDMTILAVPDAHTGLTSVQLLPPMTEEASS